MPVRPNVSRRIIGEACHVGAVRIHEEDLQVASAAGLEGDLQAVRRPCGVGVLARGIREVDDIGSVQAHPEDVGAAGIQSGIPPGEQDFHAVR